MPFSVQDFLDVLDLPTEHPYMPSQNSDIESREWSISTLFSSVSWEQSSKSQEFTDDKAINPEECADFPIPSWGKYRQDGVCKNDSTSTFVLWKQATSTATKDLTSSIGFGSGALDSVREITPCLFSFFWMNILLWAPIILLYCLRRLTKPTPSQNEEEHSKPHGVATNRNLHSRYSEYKRYSSSDFSEKSKYLNELIIAPVWKKMPSFSNYLPSLSNSTMKKEKCPRQGPPPAADQSNSFERFLFFLSLISNAITLLASFSAVFSVEDKKKDSNKKAKDGSQLEVKSPKENSMIGHNKDFVYSSDWLSCMGAHIVSAVIMTDPMYVYDFSRRALVAIHILVISVAAKRFGYRIVIWTALPVSLAAFYIMAHQDLELPDISPGLYYDEGNRFISELVKEWPMEKRTYDDGRGTPWMLTGDIRTGVPFLVNPVLEIDYTRRWVPLADEKEAVILDIAFPKSQVIEDNKAIYLILHGINGNSDEGYVVDFVSRQVSEGNIVAVMVTRGLMDSPVLGNNILHFARISDVAAVAKVLKRTSKQLSKDIENPMVVAGVGYSMGAITLANYVARTGSACDLDLAVGFSGALDTRKQVQFKRSASLWQPPIAKMMRDTLLQKFSKQIKRKFNDEQMRKMMLARSLVDFDEAFFAPYNDFESLDHYYSFMGAMGDFVSFETRKDVGSIGNVSVPLCMIQALDDPVGYWGTFHEPSKVATSGNGNTMILMTRKGGHVGWPLGIKVDGWRWMSDAASSFVEAAGRARRKLSENDFAHED